MRSTCTIKRQGGFIITIELLLITTILVIGSFAGLALIRDALVKRYVNQQSQEIEVLDASGVRLGKAIDFDEHDAPRIAYIDRTNGAAKRVLIGIRDDRFTSREPLYYEGGSCTGTPCIKRVSDEPTDSVGVSGLGGTGAVSYLNALQGTPNYAIGRADSGVAGFLYREDAAACPVNIVDIGSRWLSQKVVAGEPCEPIQFATAAPANTDCIVDYGTGEVCACPGGYSDQSDILALYAAETDALMASTLDQIQTLAPLVPDATIGSVCCPVGTSLDDSNSISEAAVAVALNSVVSDVELDKLATKQVSRILDPLAGSLTCKSSVNLRAAAEVSDPNAPELNALERFQAPFQIAAPPVAGSDAWISIAPKGESIADMP